MKHNLYFSRARGAWFIKWRSERPDGTPTWMLKAVPKAIQDEALARLWANRFTEQLTPPRDVSLSATFSDVARVWLDSKERQPSGDRKNLSGQRRFTERWLGELADVPMRSCTVAMASRWVEWVKAETKASYTARNVLQQMRNFVVEARGRGWVELEENVFLDPWIRRVLGTPAPKAGRGVIVRLEPDQVRSLLNSPHVSHERLLLYSMAVTTGLRVGELAALRRTDVRGSAVHVTRQVTDNVVKPPKKGSSRIVPLCDWVRALLDSRRTEPRLLTTCTSRDLRDDLNKALLPTTYMGHPITFHALRRTCLTMLRAAGTPLEDVSAIAGHRGMSVTDQVYAAPSLQRLREHVERAFGDLWRPLAGFRRCQGE